MVAEGADIIDIGGESTRPGAAAVTEAEEAERVVPVIKALRDAGIDVPISVDTYHSSVAKLAIEAGASLVNDVSAGEDDPKMIPFLAEHGIPVILMHKRGNAVTMDQQAVYKDVTEEVAQYCVDRSFVALQAGLPRWCVMADPGLGFAKNTEQNCTLVREIPRFRTLTRDMPLLVGEKEYIEE